MPVGFGFSASDFIAAINLVKEVIDALRESGGAGSEYQELIRELHSLEIALLEVKRLELDDSQHHQVVALRHAASQCQRTIDNFCKTIQKYQPHLRAEGSNAKFRDGWRKIQWALCKKDDLLNFRAEVMGHTISINLLLTTVQLNAAMIERKRQDVQRQTMLSYLQQTALEHMGMLNSIRRIIFRIYQQGQNLLDQTAEVYRSTMRIFQTVLEIERLIRNNLPKQVEWQQPVTILDACGRRYPFHLELVTSAEALIALLKIRFKDIGEEKIERGEYVFEDQGTKRMVNLSESWDRCFRPGQQVNMSMVFSASCHSNTCPRCHTICHGCADTEVNCPRCGMAFQRIIDADIKEKKQLQAQRSDQPQTQDIAIHPGTEETPEKIAPYCRVRMIIREGVILDFATLDGRCRCGTLCTSPANTVADCPTRGTPITFLQEFSTAVWRRISNNGYIESQMDVSLWFCGWWDDGPNYIAVDSHFSRCDRVRDIHAVYN